MAKNIFKLFALLLPLAMFACSEKDSARLEVRLTDAPGDYDAVFIDIESVEIHANGGNPSSGWTQLTDIRPGVYNLLELTNGLDTLLGSIELPAGKVSQLRLVLGSGNSLQLKGSSELIPLSTPSAQQSGLKVQIHQDLVGGVTYKILLDFDASKSIVATGGGKYSLKPIIRSIVEAQSGAVKGDIEPASVAAVYAVQGTDTVGTFSADNGEFMVKGLAPGTYSITVAPASPALPKTINNVTVTIGQVTDLGTIDL